MLTYTCINCAKSRQVPVEWANKLVTCKCGTKGLVPPFSQIAVRGKREIEIVAKPRRKRSLWPLLTLASLGMVGAGGVAFYALTNLEDKPKRPGELANTKPVVALLESAETKAYKEKLREYLTSAQTTANMLIDPLQFNQAKEALLKTRGLLAQVPDPPEQMKAIHDRSRVVTDHLVDGLNHWKDAISLDVDLKIGKVPMSQIEATINRKFDHYDQMKLDGEKAKAIVKEVLSKI